jgi:hypothetical protein
LVNKINVGLRNKINVGLRNKINVGLTNKINVRLRNKINVGLRNKIDVDRRRYCREKNQEHTFSAGDLVYNITECLPECNHKREKHKSSTPGNNNKK